MAKIIGMNHSMKTGISFGLASGIITTLGLMVGLNSGTGSKLAVVGGVLTIAIADAMSDALGIHISEESENKHTSKEIWESTIFTFLTKFFVASSFIFPLLLFTLDIAVIVNIIWGLLLLILFSYYISEEKPLRAMSEHLLIAIVVIVLSGVAGNLIKGYFG